jgi:hypothetical protein
MDPFDPILDRPHSVDYDSLDPETTFRLANHDIVFHADGQTDLRDLFWPWTDAIYARHIKLRIRDMNDDDFMPMVTQFYPGYQETILGTEGMIVSKQLAVPFNASYDRAVIWLLQCQAEGDRLLRLDIDIDWGEPLEQRLVDGLLVAQREPQSERGLYAQRNAESTRVFGNPQARPQSSDLSDPRRAQLTYYVLVNGMIEVPLLLTISDVGEQVAWNGFLALRDSELAFEQSVSEWATSVKTGRLWTPDPRFNRAVQDGRLATLRWTQRLRTGLSVTDRDISHMGILIDSLDTVELVQSRNLLANLRRLADKGEGVVPPVAPLRRKDRLADPGDALPQFNAVYLRALHDLLQRRFDAELLTQHFSTVQACAERIVREHIKRFSAKTKPADADWLVHAADALTAATRLADMAGDDADLARWESEAAEYSRQANLLGVTFPFETATPDWLAGDGDANNDPWSSITLAGQAVWDGCGVRIKGNIVVVEPTFPENWTWWALLDLPLDEEHSVSLVWDGGTLHTTTVVESRLPVRVHERIRILHTDEYDFDLQFELVDNVESGIERRIFRPKFLTE